MPKKRKCHFREGSLDVRYSTDNEAKSSEKAQGKGPLIKGVPNFTECQITSDVSGIRTSLTTQIKTEDSILSGQLYPFFDALAMRFPPQKFTGGNSNGKDYF